MEKSRSMDKSPRLSTSPDQNREITQSGKSLSISPSRDEFTSIKADVLDQLVQKAFEGKVKDREFKSYIKPYIQIHNTANSKNLNININYENLNFNNESNLCEVVDLKDKKWSAEDKLVLTSTNKSKLYFEVLHIPLTKFDLEIEPSSGSIKKGETKELTFRIRAFCTTKVYQLIKLEFYSKDQKKSSAKKQLSLKKTNSLGNSTQVINSFISGHSSDSLGSSIIPFKLDSEPSQSIDYDEIEFGDKLARGGSGTVFKANWRGNEVAAKMFPQIEDADEIDANNLKREVKLMSRIPHSHIITYMGSTQISGQPLCILMEYAKNGSLSDFLQTQTLSNRFKCKLLIDVAKGLKYLHSIKIFHRDIKSDNILVFSKSIDATVNVKITDFGASRTSSTSEKSSTYIPYNSEAMSLEQRRFTKGIGTLIYQAPELYDGSIEYSIDKTDVFSFGVLMWEVFHQQVPFSVSPYDKFSKWDIESFIKDGNRLPINKNVPGLIANLIQMCWDKDPRKRPMFEEILVELNSIYDQLTTEEETIQKKKPSSSIDTFLQSSYSLSVEDLPGWHGEISRAESEKVLEGSPPGYFLLRWSKNTKSFVLSYSIKEGVHHIGYIVPGPGGDITITKEDKSVLKFGDMTSYLTEMYSKGYINRPVEMNNGESKQNVYQTVY